MKSHQPLYASPFINQITDSLYLGCINGALNIQYLKSIGVTHVLSCCEDLFNLKSSLKDFKHQMNEITDMNNVNILKNFKDAFTFIESAKKCYVHCIAGCSRSPSFVIGYLMWKNRMAYKDTFYYVKKRRPQIAPNYAFVHQLALFETLLKENMWNLVTIDSTDTVKKYNAPKLLI